MSVQDYMSASKIGKRAYHACVNKGRYPYLPVLENIVDESDIEAEVSLGIDQIPLRLVVGTCNAGRTNAFADNFMPILDWGTEFSAKWASLSDSQKNEGIRDPIKVYEYMNKFYVLEGNKRVSVLKYFKAVTVNAEVIRKVPKYSEDPDVKIYYEFMEFYKWMKMRKRILYPVFYLLKTHMMPEEANGLIIRRAMHFYALFIFTVMSCKGYAAVGNGKKCGKDVGRV